MMTRAIILLGVLSALQSVAQVERKYTLKFFVSEPNHKCNVDPGKHPYCGDITGPGESPIQALERTIGEKLHKEALDRCALGSGHPNLAVPGRIVTETVATFKCNDGAHVKWCIKRLDIVCELILLYPGG